MTTHKHDKNKKAKSSDKWRPKLFSPTFVPPKSGEWSEWQKNKNEFVRCRRIGPERYHELQLLGDRSHLSDKSQDGAYLEWEISPLSVPTSPYLAYENPQPPWLDEKAHHERVMAEEVQRERAVRAEVENEQLRDELRRARDKNPRRVIIDGGAHSPLGSGVVTPTSSDPDYEVRSRGPSFDYSRLAPAPGLRRTTLPEPLSRETYVQFFGGRPQYYDNLEGLNRAPRDYEPESWQRAFPPRDVAWSRWAKAPADEAYWCQIDCDGRLDPNYSWHHIFDRHGRHSGCEREHTPRAGRVHWSNPFPFQ